MPQYTIDPYYSSPEWIELRTRVVQMNQNICAYCGGQGFQADHVIPRRKGGPDAISNLVCACARCNKLVGGLLFDSFSEKKIWILAKLDKRRQRAKRKRDHTKSQRQFIQAVSFIHHERPQPKYTLCTYMTMVGGERGMHKGGRRSVCCPYRAVDGSRFCRQHKALYEAGTAQRAG